MNLFVPNRARTRSASAEARNVVRIRTAVTRSRPSGVAAACGPIRARWSIDPMSGRLHCQWVSEDEVADSPGARTRSPADRRSGPAHLDVLAA